jgi:hypothetical protein
MSLFALCIHRATLANKPFFYLYLKLCKKIINTYQERNIDWQRCKKQGIHIARTVILDARKK